MPGSTTTGPHMVSATTQIDFVIDFPIDCSVSDAATDPLDDQTHVALGSTTLRACICTGKLNDVII